MIEPHKKLHFYVLEISLGPFSETRSRRFKIRAHTESMQYKIVNKILNKFQDEFCHLKISSPIETSINRKYTLMTTFRDFHVKFVTYAQPLAEI